MIDLDEKKEYFLLVDCHNESFGGYRIFESLTEVKQQFNDWGNNDEIGETKDYVLNNYSISECLELWVMSIHKYDGSKFKKCEEDKFLSFIK